MKQVHLLIPISGVLEDVPAEVGKNVARVLRAAADFVEKRGLRPGDFANLPIAVGDVHGSIGFEESRNKR